MGLRMPKHAGRVLPEIGALVEEPAAYPHMSGRANLALLDAAGPGGDRRTRRRRIGAALERVGLAGVDRRPVRAYSLGMRQRLGLAAALVRSPRLLILDEPSNGLDPRGIRDIRDLLIELNQAGTTVFLSSHLLSEVERLCTRVGILDRGRLVVQETLSALQAPTGRVVVKSPDADRVAALLDGRVETRDGARACGAPRGRGRAQRAAGGRGRAGHGDPPAAPLARATGARDHKRSLTRSRTQVAERGTRSAPHGRHCRVRRRKKARGQRQKQEQ